MTPCIILFLFLGGFMDEKELKLELFQANLNYTIGKSKYHDNLNCDEMKELKRRVIIARKKLAKYKYENREEYEYEKYKRR